MIRTYIQRYIRGAITTFIWHDFFSVGVMLIERCDGCWVIAPGTHLVHAAAAAAADNEEDDDGD